MILFEMSPKRDVRHIIYHHRTIFAKKKTLNMHNSIHAGVTIIFKQVNMIYSHF